MGKTVCRNSECDELMKLAVDKEKQREKKFVRVRQAWHVLCRIDELTRTTAKHTRMHTSWFNIINENC